MVTVLLVATVLACALRAANAKTCPAGYYLQSNSCNSCTYSRQNSTSYSACESCPAGKQVASVTTSEVLDSGLNARVLECSSCQTGYYRPTSSSYCTNCDSGKYSSLGDSTCTSTCPAGSAYQSGNNQYSGGSGSYACTPCTPGSYSSAPGSTSCSPCPLGYYSNSYGATDCVSKCAEGLGAYVDFTQDPFERRYDNGFANMYIERVANKSSCKSNGYYAYCSDYILVDKVHFYGAKMTYFSTDTISALPPRFIQGGYISIQPSYFVNTSVFPGADVYDYDYALPYLQDVYDFYSMSSSISYSGLATRRPATTCKACSSGRYSSGGVCKACTAGKYYDTSKGSCSFCPNGRSSKTPGISTVIGEAYDCTSSLVHDNSFGSGEILMQTSSSPSCEGDSSNYYSGYSSIQNCATRTKYCRLIEVADEAAANVDVCPLSCSWPFKHAWNSAFTLFIPCGTMDSIFSLDIESGIIIAVMVALAVMFLSSLLLIKDEHGKRNLKLALGLSLFCVIPAVDVMTDLAYIMSAPFFRYYYFILIAGFHLQPFVRFGLSLYERRCVPKFRILSLPGYMYFSEYNAPYKYFITSILLLPIIVINSVYLLPWYVVGVYMWSTKIFSIVSASNFWLHVWSGTDKHDYEGMIVLSVINESIAAQTAFETLPTFIMQLINNILLEAFTPVAYFSSTLSGLNLINGLYRLVFYKFYKRIRLSDIPLEVSFLGVKIIRTKKDDGSLSKKNIVPMYKSVGDTDGVEMVAAAEGTTTLSSDGETTETADKEIEVLGQDTDVGVQETALVDTGKTVLDALEDFLGQPQAAINEALSRQLVDVEDMLDIIYKECAVYNKNAAVLYSRDEANTFDNDFLLSDQSVLYSRFGLKLLRLRQSSQKLDTVMDVIEAKHRDWERRNRKSFLSRLFGR